LANYPWQSDTPGKAGGLVSVTASQAIALLNRHSGISKTIAIRSTVDRSSASVKASAPMSGLSGHKREPDSGSV